MNKILKQISKKAIELGDFEFTQEETDNKWLGTKPTTETEIKLTEKRLGVELPTDYKEFLLIANGFSAPIDVEPTFEPNNKIDFLKNIDNYIIEAYSNNGIEHIGKQLEQSIIVGGINQEQYFLLIPPNGTSDKWKYWKFANWYPGEHEFENLESYFNNTLEFINEQLKSK